MRAGIALLKKQLETAFMITTIILAFGLHLLFLFS